jgi:hypothetical protein
MGGHFDAVGFGDPGLGFEVTRDFLRRAVEQGRPAGETADLLYYELETDTGCGLSAATDVAGYLLNGCPYFRGSLRQTVQVEVLEAWDPAEPDQGGLTGSLETLNGSPAIGLSCALPHFAIRAADLRPGRHTLTLVGLGYRAASVGQLVDSRTAGLFTSSTERRDLPPIRRCNVEYRGRIERSEFLSNPITGARLAYARLDCERVRLEVVIDMASLAGGLAAGAYLEGSAWLVAAPPTQL